MTNLALVFDGTSVAFRAEDGWFNATEVAKKHGKFPADWLRQEATIEYAEELFSQLSAAGRCGPGPHRLGDWQKRFVHTQRGGKVQGTWLHPDLGVVFARWISVKFAVWCDQQIKELVRAPAWKDSRRETSVLFQEICDIIHKLHLESGEPAKAYHYSNEARLMNWALTGEFGSVDRNALSKTDLRRLIRIEAQNLGWLSAGMSYEDRRARFEQERRQRLN